MVTHFARPPDVAGGSRHYEMGRGLIGRGWNVAILIADFHCQSRQYFKRGDAWNRGEIVEEVDGVAFRYLWSAPHKRSGVSASVTFAQHIVVSRGERSNRTPHLVVESAM